MRPRHIVLTASILSLWCVSAEAQVHRHSQAPRYTYEFGAHSHADRLAVQLEREANDVCWEMYRNYRLNRGWDETYREMYKVLSDAKHIHQLVHDDYHRGANDDHIADDLHQMDKLFHHIEDDVAHWRADRQHHRRNYHDPHMHYHGDLPRKMQRFEETLHHMMTDYGVRSRIRGNAPSPDNDRGRGDAPLPQP